MEISQLQRVGEPDYRFGKALQSRIVDLLIGGSVAWQISRVNDMPGSQHFMIK